jgi:CRISPR system Cascade subunit CasB
MTEDNSFISNLELLRERKDRGALAKLRRGLGKMMGDVDMYPYVVPFLPNDKSKHHFYFLAASLFAMHPLPNNGKNQSMGEVFSQFNKCDSTEKRFKALLNADEKDLHYHLRQAISMAKSKNISIDYHRLFRDLSNWTHPDRFVQLEWARDYWA